MRDEVIACAMTTVEFKFARVPADWVFDQTVVIIAAHNVACYAVLESGIHKHWAYEMGAGFGSGGAPRYNPSRCFETFPFPIFASKAQEASLAELGDAFHDIRQRFMLKYQEGLTKTYNRINDPNEKLNEIIDLRHLHAELDRTVINAYGWNDLDLSHGFHNTKHGIRYTTSETTRRKVLDRLLALNHRRAEEEAELHVQPTPPISKRSRTKKDARDQILIEL